MTTGLVIARYQPPHITHMKVFEFAKAQGIDKLVVVKGSANKSRIPRHPFTTQECVDMVEMYLKRTGLEYIIHPIADVSPQVKLDDETLTEKDIKDYIVYVKKVIDTVGPFDILIAKNPVLVTPFERLGYKSIPPVGNINCSSTYIRREYTLRGDRCEDLLLPEQVAYMDKNGLYSIMEEIGLQEFRGELNGQT